MQDARFQDAQPQESATRGFARKASMVGRATKAIWGALGTVAAVGIFILLAFFGFEYWKATEDRRVAAGKPVVTDSLLYPTQPDTSMVAPSNAAGEMIARIEFNAQRQIIILQNEAAVRLQAAEAMFKNREFQLAVEGELRKAYQAGALEEISRANMPHLMLGFFEGVACLQNPQGCGSPTASARMMVQFWKDQAQNIGEPDLDFDRRARQSVAGYDPVTNTWSNGVETFQGQ